MTNGKGYHCDVDNKDADIKNSISKKTSNSSMDNTEINDTIDNNPESDSKTSSTGGIDATQNGPASGKDSEKG